MSTKLKYSDIENDQKAKFDKIQTMNDNKIKEAKLCAISDVQIMVDQPSHIICAVNVNDSLKLFETSVSQLVANTQAMLVNVDSNSIAQPYVFDT